MEEPGQEASETSSLEESLPERTRAIFDEIRTAVDKTNNPRLRELMTDQLDKAAKVIAQLPEDQKENYDILIHGTSIPKARQIRQQGFFAHKKYPTVFTDRQSTEDALKANPRIEQYDYSFFPTYFMPKGYMEHHFGQQGWDLVTMVVPKSSHEGSSIERRITNSILEQQDPIPGYEGIPTEDMRMIPPSFIIESSIKENIHTPSTAPQPDKPYFRF